VTKEYHASIEPSGFRDLSSNFAYGRRRGKARSKPAPKSRPLSISAKPTKVFDKTGGLRRPPRVHFVEGGCLRGLRTRPCSGWSRSCSTTSPKPRPRALKSSTLHGARRESTIASAAWPRTADALGRVTARGCLSRVPQNIADALSANLAASSEIDSEQVGIQIFVFDLLKLAGNDLRGLGYGERLKALDATLVPTYSR